MMQCLIYIVAKRVISVKKRVILTLGDCGVEMGMDVGRGMTPRCQVRNEQEGYFTCSCSCLDGLFFSLTKIEKKKKNAAPV